MEVEQSENPSSQASETSSTTDLKEMWHPHVYRPPPKSPTPFSIDDILHSQNNPSPKPLMTPSAMAATAAAMSNLANFTPEEWLRVAYYINNAMQQGQKMIHSNSANLTSSEESGRDSTESTNITTGDEDETQPLNLSLTTSTKKSSFTGDPYDRDFLLDSKSGN